MKTVEQLESELKDTLARERQLREALARLVDENPKSDILCDDGFTFSFQKNSRVHKRALEALSTPAPRVFTAEEVQPLVEALHEAIESSIAHISGSIQSGSPLDRWIKTLTHARKLGMEGA